jgi:hypothetical protein
MSITRKNRLGVTFGVAGAAAAVIAMTLTPALGASNATSPAPLHTVRNNGPVNLTNGDTVLVSLALPAGRWLLVGKLWADSVGNSPTPNVVVGCHLQRGGSTVDSIAFNVPKLGGPGGSAAGTDTLSAIVRLGSPGSVSLQCNDFGSQAIAHQVVLSAVG